MLFFSYWVVSFGAFLTIDVLLRRDGGGNDIISMACGAVFALVVTFCLFLVSTVVPVLMPFTKFYLIAFAAAVASQPLGMGLLSPRRSRRPRTPE